MTRNLSAASRVLLVIAAALLIYSAFVPIWQIDLSAPQYPEGLNLKIYANKLGGDVEIINGLNHYIGMKTLHTENFIEFSVLRYIIFFYAGFAVIAAAVGKKKIAYILFTLFVLFGIVAMIDFWRWEYNYGHDLDPKAAIIVPGMAYQPPLIGFKQLLNFGAYSIPDTGGWLFVGSGVLMLFVTLKESAVLSKLKRKKKEHIIPSFLCVAFLFSCAHQEPEPIRLSKDGCDHCKMTIADKRFACELVTEKGRVYKFDDLSCMLRYNSEHKDKTTHAHFYISTYPAPNALLLSNKLFFIKGENVGSPMGGNVAAFANQDSASVYAGRWNASTITWEHLNP